MKNSIIIIIFYLKYLFLIYHISVDFIEYKVCIIIHLFYCADVYSTRYWGDMQQVSSVDTSSCHVVTSCLDNVIDGYFLFYWIYLWLFHQAVNRGRCWVVNVSGHFKQDVDLRLFRFMALFCFTDFFFLLLLLFSCFHFRFPPALPRQDAQMLLSTLGNQPFSSWLRWDHLKTCQFLTTHP